MKLTLLASLALVMGVVLSGCSSTAVPSLGEKTAANATLVSSQIKKMEGRRQSLVRFHEDLLLQRTAQTTGKESAVAATLAVWKAAGAEHLLESFTEYQSQSEKHWESEVTAPANTAAFKKRIADQLPSATTSAAQLETLSKLLAEISAKESLTDAIKRYQAFWKETKELIDAEVKKSDAAAPVSTEPAS